MEAAPDLEVHFEFEFTEAIEDWDGPDLPPVRAMPSGMGNDFVPLNTKPEILRWVVPEYPEAARDLELQGVVLVNVYVGADGRAQAAELVRGVHPILDREALQAALRCVFTPGTQQDHAVGVWVSLPFSFRLH